MALGSTQPLTNEYQVYFLGVKIKKRLTTLPPSCAVVMKSGNLNFLEPSGPLQACNGTALPLHSYLTANTAFKPSSWCDIVRKVLYSWNAVTLCQVRQTVTIARDSSQYPWSCVMPDVSAELVHIGSLLEECPLRRSLKPPVAVIVTYRRLKENLRLNVWLC
jgi:hypothetical protein